MNNHHSLQLVPSRVNMSITTPISAKMEMESLICTRFSKQADQQPR